MDLTGMGDTVSGCYEPQMERCENRNGRAVPQKTPRPRFRKAGRADSRINSESRPSFGSLSRMIHAGVAKSRNRRPVASPVLTG